MGEEISSETRKTLGGGEETVTTYSYEKKWTTDPVSSEGFRTQVQKRQFYTGRFRGRGHMCVPSDLGAYVLPQFW